MEKAVWGIIKKNLATETDPATKNVKTIMRQGSWEDGEPGNQGAGEPGSHEDGKPGSQGARNLGEMGRQEAQELEGQGANKPGSEGAPAENIERAVWLLNYNDT